MSDDRPRVAIACQGGGSHTAFTAGVLGRLFADDVRHIPDAEELEDDHRKDDAQDDGDADAQGVDGVHESVR